MSTCEKSVYMPLLERERDSLKRNLLVVHSMSSEVLETLS